MWYIETMEYYSAIKQMSFAATRVDLEIIILSEVSQKEKYDVISLICGISNTTQMNLSTKWK